MQVNVTASIDGPSGQELAAKLTVEIGTVRVSIREPGPAPKEAAIDVTLANLRTLVAKLEALNA
jgi:hypothetical protein